MWNKKWFVFLWIFVVTFLVPWCTAEEREEAGEDYVSPFDRYDDDGNQYLNPDEEQELLFDRERRKYSRRLWYINCTRRRRCHCYSRRLRQYFCCTCDSGPCFPGDSEVTLIPSGVRIPMHQLRLGQHVLAANEQGELVGSKVLGFLDKRPNETAEYITFVLASGRSVSLSATHLLYAASWINSSEIESGGIPVSIPSQPTYADQVHVGQYLFVPDEGLLKADPVVKVTHSLKLGAYVPLTVHGRIIIDGALASCYASFPHWLSHAFLAPARLFPEILLDTETSQDDHGLRTFPFILKMVGQLFSKIRIVDNHKPDDIIRFNGHDEVFRIPSL